MDARPRERLPALPALVAALDRHRKDTHALLGSAEGAGPGEAFIAAGSAFVRGARAGGI